MSRESTSVVVGARVTLRAPDANDVERLVTFQTENRTRFAPLDGDRPEGFYTSAWWARRVAMLVEGERVGRLLYRLVFADSEPERVAGVVSFPNIVDAPFYASEIGFAIDARHEGTSLMRPSLELAIAEVFERRGLHRLTAEYAMTNVRSERLLARLGFQKEGLRRSYMRVAGGWEDFVITALINKEWREAVR